MNLSALIANLNIIDVVIIAILLLSLIAGMYKGFIASALTAVGFVASAFGAYHFGPQLATLVQSNTGLMNSDSYYLGASQMLGTSLAEQTVVNAVTDANQMQAAKATLTKLQIPTPLVELFESNAANQLFKSLNLTTMGDYLSQTLLVSTVYVLSFLAVFAVCYIATLLIVNLMNNVFRFPLLKHFDWMLGGIFGLARGVLIVLIILAVVPMVSSIVEIDIVTKMIEQSQLATYLSKDTADMIIERVSMLAFQSK